MSKRTYINLINDFWDKYAQEPISTPAAMVYLYLLNRINRDRWEPIFISNSELAKGANIGRRSLPAYKVEIAGAGLLTIEDQGEGRTAGTVYGLPAEEPETAQKVTVKLRKNAHNNRAKTRNSDKETAQKRAINRAKMRSLEPSTPINDIYKDNIRPSTAPPAGAGARTREEEIFNNLKFQIAEMKASQIWMEQTQKQFRMTPQEIEAKLDEFLTEMTSQGEIVQKPRMLFNYWLSRKRNQKEPSQTRNQHRRELLEASYRVLQEGLADPFGQNGPQAPEPF